MSAFTDLLRSRQRSTQPGWIERSASIDDLRQRARRRLPRSVFDYVDGGAEDELTLRANREAFDRIGFSPRVLTDVSELDTSVELFGRTLPMPVVLAPTGFTRLVHPDGERAVARAAARVSLPYTLSTMGTCSIEDVAAASPGAPHWFQLYVWRDRGLMRELVDRALAADYEALMLTVDVPVLGRRERDTRNGATIPPRLSMRTIVDGMLHPQWSWDFLRADPLTFANVSGRADLGAGIQLGTFINSQFDPTLSWRDVDWLREHWPRPLLLKGVQRVADARQAAAAQVDGLILSNHGGRQLDGAPTALDLLEPVLDAIGDLPVLIDGGVRRGSDVLKAVALGARAVLIGRAYLYGLGAGGEAGVDLALELLRGQLERTMALVGSTELNKAGRDLLR